MLKRKRTNPKNAEEKTSRDDTKDLRPLHYAIKTDFSEGVKMLFESKADPNLTTPKYGTALDYAVTLNKLPMVQLLLESTLSAIKVTQDNLNNALLNAIKNGYQDIVNLLLKHTINPFEATANHEKHDNASDALMSPASYKRVFIAAHAEELLTPKIDATPKNTPVDTSQTAQQTDETSDNTQASHTETLPKLNL